MNFINIKIEDYCVNNSMTIPSYLIDLEKTTYLNTTTPQMIAGRLQGRILSFISKMVRPEFILEIGTFTGYSSLCLAEGLQDDGKIITFEINNEYKEIIDQYHTKSPYKNKIDVRFANAIESIPSLNYSFDLIFIDGHKLDYQLYFDLVSNKLNHNGIIIIDNVLWSGKVIFELEDKTAFTLNEFNRKININPNFEVIMLPIRDGMTLVKRKVGST